MAGFQVSTEADFPAAFEHGCDNGLADSSTMTALEFSRFHIAMHIAGSATDETLIDLYLAGKFTAVLGLHSEANAMEHEPRGLLGDA
jgi:hypothetical protein